MDIFEIRKKLKTKSVYEMPLRVTFYARVSSEKDAQLNSLDNQIDYYTDFIKKRTAWTYVPGYVDEGITGIMTTKREQFHQMIDDAEHGLFDVLITKEISRFARNTLDSIHYTRELLSFGVGVIFENDGINTLDEDAELRLTIMSAIAQDEVRKLSSRVRFGHQQAIKNGIVLGNGLMYGYRQEKGKLIIDPEQARMVKMVFEYYASGNYSLKQLEQVLADEGYVNKRGKPISHCTLSNIITNPKYKGYYVGNKVRVTDMFTKHQKFLDPSEWVVFKDETGETVPAIVSEELWEQANEIHTRRGNDVKTRQNLCTHGNLLTGKLYCTHCGATYYRKDSVDRHGNRNSRWACSAKLKNGAASCPSGYLFESELRPILFEVFTEMATNIDKLLEQYKSYYLDVIRENDASGEKAELEKRAEKVKLKKKKLLEFNVDGKITDADYVAMNNDLMKELIQIDSDIFEIEQRERTAGNIDEKLAEIRTVFIKLKNGQNSEVTQDSYITNEFVTKYIDRIDVTQNGDEVQLNIKLLAGKTVNKVLFSRIRPGSMFKRMIEDYERRSSGSGM